MNDKLLAEMAEAEKKAIDAMARYKFWTFAYNAAWWVKLNRLAGAKKPNPFAFLVKAAREKVAAERYQDAITGANPRATAKLIEGLRRTQ